MPSLEQCCAQCGTPLGSRRHCLDRRVEVVDFCSQEQSITVLSGESVYLFCGFECWSRYEKNVIELLGLINTYPVFDRISSCCRCRGPVDRASGYVAYAIMDQILEVKPWLTTCYPQDDAEFAILCNQCDFPSFESEEEANGERDQLLNDHAFENAAISSEHIT